MVIAEIEKLERDIISTKHNLVEGRSSLSTVLTQTRIFCKKLDVNYEWINNELDGYKYKNLNEANENIPAYRKVTYQFLNMFNNPIIIDNPQNDDFIKNLICGPLVIPITNFQGVHEGGVLIIRDGPPIVILHIFAEKNWIQWTPGSHELAGISARVNNNQLLSIYDKVKNLTIEQLSDLEDEVKKVKLA